MISTSEKVILIRRGNELFNKKDYKNALKIYLAVDYKDGIARMAGILEHEKKDLIAALKLYKKAGMHGNVEKIAYDMAQTVRFLIKEDKELNAKQNGENFNAGSKISGQAPTMLPHEALWQAKVNLGIAENPIAKMHQHEVIRWKPEQISKQEINKIKKK